MSDTAKTVDDVRAILVKAVSVEGAIPLEDVATDRTFTSYGLDSMAALAVGVEIEDSLGLSDLPVSLLWDYPTVDTLAEALWQMLTGEFAEPALAAQGDE